MILVISSKSAYATKRLQEEAQKLGVVLDVIGLNDLVTHNFKVKIKDYEVLYIRDPYLKGNPNYLPNVIKLAKKFKTAGKKVVDSTITNGNLGQGKWQDYQKLNLAALPIPKTRLLTDYPLSTIHYPLILKWIYGFKARNVFLVKNRIELNRVLEEYPKDEMLAQEFIDADYEYKVICVGYKALPVVLRFAINKKTLRPDFTKADVLTMGFHPGIFDSRDNQMVKNIRDREIRTSPEKPSTGSRLSDALGRDGVSKLISIAEKSSRLLKRELSKVDILEAKGKFYILEVNRFPGLESFEKKTKYNVVGEFINYLISTEK